MRHAQIAEGQAVGRRLQDDLFSIRGCETFRESLVVDVHCEPAPRIERRHRALLVLGKQERVGERGRGQVVLSLLVSPARTGTTARPMRKGVPACGVAAEACRARRARRQGLPGGARPGNCDAGPAATTRSARPADNALAVSDRCASCVLTRVTPIGVLHPASSASSRMQTERARSLIVRPSRAAPRECGARSPEPGPRRAPRR